MKPNFILAATLSTVLALAGSSRPLSAQTGPATFTTRITGEVVGRPQSRTLWLTEYDADLRFATPVSIPIRDGRFDYTLTDSIVRGYQFVFEEEAAAGSVFPIPFLNEPGELKATLYGEDREQESRVDGGVQNRELQDNRREMFRRYARHTQMGREIDDPKYLSDTAKVLLSILHAPGTPEEERLQYEEKARQLYADKAVYTAEGYALLEAMQQEWARAGADELAASYRRCADEPGLAHLFLLRNMITQQQLSDSFRDSLTALLPQYERLFPQHPFMQRIRNTLAATEMTDGRQRFIDFKLPCLDGTEKTLSELVRGKVAVIDLWASWCGPCRRHSKALIPIYEEYKDKGFTVVGIAREWGNTRAMEAAVEKDGYPWVQLYELDDRQAVWERYGVPQSGGAIFLIDKKGNVVERDPSPESIRPYLEQQ